MSTRDELAAINADMSRAFAAQDTEALVDHYTDDAVLLTVNQPMGRGREEIRARFEAMLASSGVTVTFETIDVLEDSALVVDVGRYSTPGRQGKYCVVYRRQPDGSLKIAVDAASSDGEPN